MRELLADRPIWFTVFVVTQVLFDIGVVWAIAFHIWNHHEEVEVDWSEGLSIPAQRTPIEDRLPGRHRLT